MNFHPPLSQNDAIALTMGDAPIAIASMDNKERQRKYKESHPDSWQQTANRIGLKATIRLYTDKEADLELLTALEAERLEGESDRDLVLRMIRKAVNL